MIPLLLSCPLLLSPSPQADELNIDAPGAAIEHSCEVSLGSPVLADPGGGAIRIEADDVTVDLAGAHLRGAPEGTPGDQLEGVGILVTGKRVTLRNGSISGYRCAVLARGADGLVLEDLDVSGNFRQRLASTPRAEDAADWLRPHENDENEWLERYGAGIWIEEAQAVTVRRCRARRGQNGIVLDRVEGGAVYDNDLSFLSGWGLAMWRSSRTTITRNAFDFCVRGYSHGIYNRGQDSAGILMFEQCGENLVAENSVTHGGDGIFGFAGREALGEVPAPSSDFGYDRRGNNDNLFTRNDLSYAAAHGLELTFSFGNRIEDNRFVANAICGIWGGYSSETLVLENRFALNGEGAYGLERGGINVEHGRDWVIANNRFDGNRCGVHLWTDADPHLVDTPWARANGVASRDNDIVENAFKTDELAIQLRGSTGTWLKGNTYHRVGAELERSDDVVLRLDPRQRPEAEPAPAGRPTEVLGDTRPVGAHSELAGREHIVLDQWGPYDWERPHLQLVEADAAPHIWRLLGPAELESTRVLSGQVELAVLEEGGQTRIAVAPAAEASVVPYRIAVSAGGETVEGSGVLISTTWSVAVFAWTVDPREDHDGWAAEARAAERFLIPNLRLPYGTGGPSQLSFAPDTLRAADLPTDRFGTVAATMLELPAGSWRLRSLSDDGIRVRVGEEVLIDDWTWHGPTVHEAEFTRNEPGQVLIVVEHFELDGHAVLELELEPAP